MNANSEVVSFESEELILVDEQDNEIGSLSKELCHDGQGVLHRAFSVFLFNAEGELLLQQRSGGKRLWPSFWSNSCCSHPRRGESMQQATQRRIQQELGVVADLEYIYKFTYQARFEDVGSEYECCSVFLGRITEPVVPNSNEIAAVRFVGAAQLREELLAGGRFTPWFRMEWERLQEDFGPRLGSFASEE